MRRSHSHSATVGHDQPGAGATAAHAQTDGAAARERSAARVSPRTLVGVGVAVEAFLLALLAVAPLGGLSQTISPLARAWQVLLGPAKLVFCCTAV